MAHSNNGTLFSPYFPSFHKSEANFHCLSVLLYLAPTFKERLKFFNTLLYVSVYRESHLYSYKSSFTSLREQMFGPMTSLTC